MQQLLPEVRSIFNNFGIGELYNDVLPINNEWDNFISFARKLDISINDKKIGVYACTEIEFTIATVDTAGANPFDPFEIKFIDVDSSTYPNAHIDFETGHNQRLSLDNSNLEFVISLQHTDDYVDIWSDYVKVKVIYEDGTEDEAVAVAGMLDIGPRVIAVTRDRNGSTLFTATGRTDIPIVLADQLVDATGSGDTYAIGFLLEYSRTENIRQSGLFAASCASFNLENIGPCKMPSRDQVMTRVSRFEQHS